MQRFLHAILLLSLSWTVWGAWDGGRLLKRNATEAAPSVYVDPITNKTYAFYGYYTYKDSNLMTYFCFQVITIDEKGSEERCIRQQRQVLSLSVAAYRNEIYVLYSGTRSLGGTNCYGNETDGCVDVFFTESRDAGKLWSEPRQISRSKLDDAAYRIEPRLVYIKGADRLYAAFTRKESGDSRRYLMYATRPRLSMIFGTEKEVGSEYESINNLFLGPTTLAGKPTLYLAYRSNEYLSYYSYVTSSETWEGPTRLISSYDRYNYSMSTSYTNNNIYVISLRQEIRLDLFWLSQPQANWHTRKLPFTSFEKLFQPIVLAVPNDTQKLIFTAKLNTERLSTFVFDVEWEELTDLHEPPPLSPYPQGMGVLFYDKVKFRVLNYIGTDLYLSTFVYTPTTRKGPPRLGSRSQVEN